MAEKLAAGQARDDVASQAEPSGGPPYRAGLQTRRDLKAEIGRPGRAVRSSQAVQRETYGEKACRDRGV